MLRVGISKECEWFSESAVKKWWWRKKKKNHVLHTWEMKNGGRDKYYSRHVKLKDLAHGPWIWHACTTGCVWTMEVTVTFLELIHILINKYECNVVSLFHFCFHYVCWLVHFHYVISSRHLLLQWYQTWELMPPSVIFDEPTPIVT